MEQIETKIKRWGNSFGVIVPINFIKKENLKEGSKVKIFIRAERKTKAGEIFGILKGKLKKDTALLMKEVDDAFEPKQKR
jgi:antitoxin component of MazEF toxin-antitoxin module